MKLKDKGILSADRKATLVKKIKDSVPGWIFVLPLVVGMLVFTLYPVLKSLIYSFHRYNDASVYEFIGFGNFRLMFTDDSEEILKVFSNTFLFFKFSYISGTKRHPLVSLIQCLIGSNFPS